MNKAVVCQNMLSRLPSGQGLLLKQLGNVEMRFYCPQAFVISDSCYAMDVFAKP